MTRCGRTATISGNRIAGAASFYLVRGDSAQIPPDLQARGLRPDRSRWWIERWEDETLRVPGRPGMATMPGRSITFGELKMLYR